MVFIGFPCNYPYGWNHIAFITKHMADLIRMDGCLHCRQAIV